MRATVRTLVTVRDGTSYVLRFASPEFGDHVCAWDEIVASWSWR